MNNNNRQQGITLIEMMIAMLIGLILSGAVISIFVSNVKSSTENMRMMRLNQELRGTMTFISDELKRAGFSADATNSDFMGDFNFNVASSCLRYSYDEDGNGLQGTDERFGFQLTASAVRWSNNVTTTNCSNGTWQNVTDTTIAPITAFTVTENPISAGTIDINHLVLVLTGQITLNPNTASRTITETIRVRNEDPS